MLQQSYLLNNTVNTKHGIAIGDIMARRCKDAKSFNDIFIHYKKMRGATYRGISKITGMSRQYLADIHSKRRTNVSLPTAFKIMNVLNIPVAELQALKSVYK